jgi:predicted enzyme related to lactoylglutathione lyase
MKIKSRSFMAAVFLVAVLVTFGAIYHFFIKSGDNMSNPVVYFEIPVSNLERAVEFYGKVFGFDFTREEIHGNKMALFPLNPDQPGITGALAQGEIYHPTKDGVLIYFQSSNIDETLKKAIRMNAKILFPKTMAGDYGFVAEIQDSEGNRIGLSQK